MLCQHVFVLSLNWYTEGRCKCIAVILFSFYHYHLKKTKTSNELSLLTSLRSAEL